MRCISYFAPLSGVFMHSMDQSLLNPCTTSPGGHSLGGMTFLPLLFQSCTYIYVDTNLIYEITCYPYHIYFETNTQDLSQDRCWDPSLVLFSNSLQMQVPRTILIVCTYIFQRLRVPKSFRLFRAFYMSITPSILSNHGAASSRVSLSICPLLWSHCSL